MKKEKTLTYKDETHQYFLDGKEIPSVSKIVDFAVQSDIHNIDPEILKKASEYGTFVHDTIETYERTKCVDGFGRDVIDTYVRLKEEAKLEIENMEQMVSDYKYFAGRYDILGKDGYLYDIKTTSTTYKKFDDKWSWQLSLYQYALGVEKDKAFIIYMSKPTSKIKPKVIPVTLHTFKEVEMLLEMYEEYKSENIRN